MKTVQATFTKRALVALIAGGTLLAAAAYAMPDAPGSGNPRCEQRDQQNQSRMEQRKQHMAALKEKLKLTPSQEAAWDKFATSAQPGQRNMDRQAMREEFQKMSTPERLDKMQVMSEMRRARMMERVEALKEFYAQLTPEQQSVFDAELMSHRQERARHHHRSHS